MSYHFSPVALGAIFAQFSFSFEAIENHFMSTSLLLAGSRVQIQLTCQTCRSVSILAVSVLKALNPALVGRICTFLLFINNCGWHLSPLRDFRVYSLSESGSGGLGVWVSAACCERAKFICHLNAFFCPESHEMRCISGSILRGCSLALYCLYLLGFGVSLHSPPDNSHTTSTHTGKAHTYKAVQVNSSKTFIENLNAWVSEKKKQSF